MTRVMHVQVAVDKDEKTGLYTVALTDLLPLGEHEREDGLGQDDVAEMLIDLVGEAGEKRGFELPEDDEEEGEDDDEDE